MQKVTAKFKLRSGQTIVCVMNTPLKEKMTLPISGYEYNFEYKFTVVTGGEKPSVAAVYYFEVRKE